MSNDSRDELGDRLKAYEARETERRFLPMCPVYARIDGRNFSSFTRGIRRPFDMAMTEVMLRTTESLVEETHARIGYTQSDEISLVWLAERSDSSIFFDHKIMKMGSVLASYAAAAFVRHLRSQGEYPDLAELLPHFDCRVFQLPNRAEATNAFLWRELDATKNAVSMAARAFCSHKDLDRKSGAEMQEMLFSKGVNFNDYPAFFKRGTFVRREAIWREFTEAELSAMPPKHRPLPAQKVQRNAMVRMEMPRFGSVVNREAVIFDGAAPEVRLEEVE